MTYPSPNQTIHLTKGTILVFSYVGYNTEEITVGNRTVIDIEMIEDITALSEVVITALGIKREEKSLGYSVAQVDSEELRELYEVMLGEMFTDDMSHRYGKNPGFKDPLDDSEKKE